MSTDLYSDPRWKRARHQALLRAQYKCQNCRCDVRGKGRSRVDHIKRAKDFPALVFDPANLRVLCPACDNARHSEKGRGGIEKPAIGLDGLPDSWR